MDYKNKTGEREDAMKMGRKRVYGINDDAVSL